MIDTALEALRLGKLVLLVDDVATVPSTFIIGPALSISAETVCFLVNEARGVVCVALSEAKARELDLPMMVPKIEAESPDFTVSVEAREGVTTGISAADRARTIRALAETEQAKLDLVNPGHIFPVRAKNGGVLVRNGVPEAAVDLLTLAGLKPIAVLCRCLDEEGDFAGEEAVNDLAVHFGMASVAVSDVVRKRLASESIIEQIAETTLPTRYAGVFRACCFRAHTDGTEHLALVKESDAVKDKAPLVRVQAENRVSDLLGLPGSFGRQRIVAALERIGQEGCGVFVYVRHPHREIMPGLTGIRSAASSRSGVRHLREYGIGAQILSHLGVSRVRLLTSSDKAIAGIAAFGIEIVEQVPFAPTAAE